MSSQKLTFLDANVLITIYRGEPTIAAAALNVITDSEREFVGSDFLKLEVLPKPVHYKLTFQQKFYEQYFAAVKTWVRPSQKLFKEAYVEACENGLSAFDALHVVTAAASGAVELITTEKPSKPIYRTRRVSVRYLLSL